MLLFEFQSPTITPQQLDELETYIDRLFAVANLDIEFTKHFQHRLRDERNKPAITIYELQRMFKKVYRQMHKGKDLVDLGPDAEAVLKDMASNINVPFVIKWDQEDLEFDLVAKTILRKPNFKTSNNILTVESLKWYEREEIIEGRKIIISDIASMQLSELHAQIIKRPELFEDTKEYKGLGEFIKLFIQPAIVGEYYNYATLFAIISAKIINIKHTSNAHKLIRKSTDYYWFDVDGQEKRWPEYGTINGDLLKYTLLFKNRELDKFLSILMLKYSEWNITHVNL